MDVSAERAPGLCDGRTPSTLVRLLVAAHRGRACPADSSVPATPARILAAAPLAEGVPLAHGRRERRLAVPDAVAPAAAERLTRACLARRAGHRGPAGSAGHALTRRGVPDPEEVVPIR